MILTLYLTFSKHYIIEYEIGTTKIRNYEFLKFEISNIKYCSNRSKDTAMWVVFQS